MTDWSKAGRQSWKTWRIYAAFIKAHAAEAASKAAFEAQFERTVWCVAFCEGKTGAFLTGIIDAVAFRLGPRKADADVIDIRLIQLKGGKAGVSGREIARLKRAATGARVSWMIAAFDGEKRFIRYPNNNVKQVLMTCSAFGRINAFGSLTPFRHVCSPRPS